MSCTAPIDITKINNICDLKCSYSFQYNNSSTTVKNQGGYLSLSYDQASIPPVTYNAEKYQVREVRLYQPSLHTYAGKKANAEMIIVHSSGSQNLLVCIPIVKSESNTSSALALSQIIPETLKLARNVGDSAQIPTTSFNLNDFIPMKPFYSYIATLPYAPCSGTYNYIVYDKNEAFATITDETLDQLKLLISASQAPIKKTSFYYNKKGPVKNIYGDGDIYIECNPTGSDGELLIKEQKDGGSGSGGSGDLGEHLNMKEIVSNPFFQFIVAMIVTVIIWKLGKFLIGKVMDTNAVKKPIGTINT